MTKQLLPITQTTLIYHKYWDVTDDRSRGQRLKHLKA